MSNDGPCHVFAAYVHNHYNDAATAFSTYYDLNSPGSARGFFEVQVALEPLFGWQTAWRANVVIACELWAFAFLAFVAAIDPSRKWIGLLGFPLGTLLNGYNEDHVRPELKATIERFRRADAPITLDGPVSEPA